MLFVWEARKSATSRQVPTVQARTHSGSRPAVWSCAVLLIVDWFGTDNPDSGSVKGGKIATGIPGVLFVGEGQAGEAVFMTLPDWSDETCNARCGRAIPFQITLLRWDLLV